MMQNIAGEPPPASPHPNPLPEGEGAKAPVQLEHKPARHRAFVSDEVAYILPMAAFLIFTWAGGHWPSFYIASYVLKSFIAALLLVLLWRHYTKIRWDYWWLGIL